MLSSQSLNINRSVLLSNRVLLRSVPTVFARLQSSNSSSSSEDVKDSNSTSSSVANESKESAKENYSTDLLLDQLFKKNRQGRKYYYMRGSFQDNQIKANTQIEDRFKILDQNLAKFKAATPINFNYYLRNIKDLKNVNQLPYNFGKNQAIKNDPNIEQHLKNIVWEFNAPIRFAFGYGSKVFNQGSDVDVSKSQIDMIYAVSYPDHWHAINLKQYPEHYSSIKHLGAGFISTIQDLGAGVYFNPFVKMNLNNKEGDSLNQELKYGVTSIDNLVDDLINWRTMYVSGRLHKPVAIIRNSPKIKLLQQYNLINAVKLSLLLLSNKNIDKSEFIITENELYHQIASLSYIGDPRLKVKGENPNKVNNIVSNQFNQFSEMYLPLIENYFPTIIQKLDNNNFIVNNSSESKASLLVDLPRAFRKRVYSKYASKFTNELNDDLIAQSVLKDNKILSIPKNSNDIDSSNLSFLELNSITSKDELLNNININDWEYLSNDFKLNQGKFVKSIANDSSLYSNLVNSIEETVYKPALVQSVKGLLTAGLLKSWNYASEKRRKYSSGSLTK